MLVRVNICNIYRQKMNLFICNVTKSDCASVRGFTRCTLPSKVEVVLRPQALSGS